MKEKPYIGGSFELAFSDFARSPEQELESYFGLTSHDRSFSTGRAAFRAILRSLDLADRMVLIPDYLCDDVLLPVLRAESIEWATYPVSRDLTIDPERLRERVDLRTGAILLINYFGFCDYASLAAEIRTWDVPVAIVLDNVQALYDCRATSPSREWADYVFTSLRKFVAVPDGAFARGRIQVDAKKVPDSGDGPAFHIMAAGLRHAFISGVIAPAQEMEAEAAYLRLFEAAKGHLNTEPSAMTRFSRELVRRLPLDEYARQRRENYAFLAQSLGGMAGIRVLRPDLSAGAAPMALPVTVADGKRNSLLAFLATQQIFCAIHWRLSPELRRTASPDRRHLSDSILSLPVDQRYTPAHLDRLVEAIHKFRMAA